MTLALMILVPLAAALLLVLLGSRIGRTASAIVGTGALIVVLGSAGAVAQAFAAGKTSLVAELGPWLPIRGAAMAFVVDPGTVPLLLATASIAAVLGLYAAVSLRRDPLAVHFFVALDLLLASLVTVLMARDLILLVAGWQGVGVSAYLLLAPESYRPEISLGAARAFVIARAGDAALLIAALSALALFQTVDLEQINGRLAASAPGRPADGLLALGVLVILAALGRTGQLPFDAWLPDRSQSHPAPVAAIHGLATASGAFLLIRLATLVDPEALRGAAGFGIASAILAMIAAIAGRPVSHVRWSTSAQLGLVVAACGLVSPSVGLIVIGSAIVRSTVALLADPLPRLARLLGAAGIVGAAVVLLGESPAPPFLAGLVVVAVLAGSDALVGLGGDRIGVLAPLARATAPVAAAFRLLGRRVDATFRTSVALVDEGTTQVMATTEMALARAAVGTGAALGRFQRASLWAHEALLLVAAAVIVTYWIVR